VTRPRITFFDLDHTLLPLDSDFSWGEFTCTIGWTDPVVFKRRNDEHFQHYLAGTLDIHDYVRFAVEAMRVRGEAAYYEARERYMREVIRPAMLPVAFDLVRGHQRAGDTVLIVTATNELVTRPIATEFGVDERIAVDLERGPDGWITGEVKGVPSMREGKVIRVQKWMEDRGIDWLDVETTFYSDSTNDIPLLEKVNHPVATNPSPALRNIAIERGWRILDLFS
jgi:HAD superfamily hydrolase (TIGR01490 family)